MCLPSHGPFVLISLNSATAWPPVTACVPARRLEAIRHFRFRDLKAKHRASGRDTLLYVHTKYVHPRPMRAELAFFTTSGSPLANGAPPHHFVIKRMLAPFASHELHLLHCVPSDIQPIQQAFCVRRPVSGTRSIRITSEPSRQGANICPSTSVFMYEKQAKPDESHPKSGPEALPSPDSPPLHPTISSIQASRGCRRGPPLSLLQATIFLSVSLSILRSPQSKTERNLSQ